MKYASHFSVYLRVWLLFFARLEEEKILKWNCPHFFFFFKSQSSSFDIQHDNNSELEYQTESLLKCAECDLL